MCVDEVPTKEIAEKVGLSQRSIEVIMNWPEFIQKRYEVNEQGINAAKAIFTNNVTSAAKQIVKMMKEGKGKDRLKFDAAKEIIYQCGGVPKAVIETITREYSTEEIQSSVSAVREVENIVNRLSVKKSDFLLEKVPQEPVNEPTNQAS
jgi:hypothetical protein